MQRDDNNLSLAKLPNDLLMRICDFVAPSTIFHSLTLTCNSLKAVTTSTEFIHHQYRHYFGVTPDELLQNFQFWFEMFSHFKRDQDFLTTAVVACIIEDLETFKKLVLTEPKYITSFETSYKTELQGNHFLAFHNIFLSSYETGSQYSSSNFYSFLKQTNRTLCLNYYTDNMWRFPKKYKGVSPFILAARFGRFSVVKEMFAQDNTLLDTTDSHNYTALMWASAHDYVDIVQFLLENNPNLSIRTKYTNASRCNHNALDLAITGRATQVIPLLLTEYAIKLPNAKPAITKPLSYAIENQWADVVETLLHYDNQIPLKENSQENNLLFYAVKNSHVDIVRILLNYSPFLLYEDTNLNINDLLNTALARNEAMFQLLTGYLLNEQKEIIYQDLFKQQSLLFDSMLPKINIKLQSIKAMQINYIFKAASLYALEKIKSLIENFSNNERNISNTIKMLNVIVDMHNHFSDLKRTEDISKFLFLMINTSINIIFGHDHFIQRQINSNKTHLAIPNCYYQFLQDMEKHIPAHNQSASTFLNCGQK